jgi:hypothetical protein
VSTRRVLLGFPEDEPEKDVLWICCPPAAPAGFLTTTYKGEQIVLSFQPAKMGLILLLNEELLADIQDGKPPETQGWRLRDELIPLLDDPAQQSESVSRTIWHINRAFRTAAGISQDDKLAARLIETKPRIGVRLSRPFQVKPLNSRPDGGSA